MGSLDDLKYWRKRPEAWRDLTRRGLLFRELREAVRNRTAAGLMRVVQECEAFAIDSKTRHDWETVRTLVWCAEQAASFPDFYRTEIDRVCFALAETPPFIKTTKTFAWTCIRTFLDTPSRAVEVPVAVWDAAQGEDEGFIATLVLEALDGGPAHLVHHPGDVFCTIADDQFRASMQHAWIAADKLVRKDRPELQSHGRWRLLRQGQPVAEVRGGSAGGAGVRGWWFALQGKVPDEGLIVLAEVDANGVLSPVDGVHAKVKAIAADDRFDTILVADAGNQGEGVRALDEVHRSGTGRSHSIRVVDISSGKFKLVNLKTGSVTEGVLRASDT